MSTCSASANKISGFIRTDPHRQGLWRHLNYSPQPISVSSFVNYYSFSVIKLLIICAIAHVLNILCVQSRKCNSGLTSSEPVKSIREPQYESPLFKPPDELSLLSSLYKGSISNAASRPIDGIGSSTPVTHGRISGSENRGMAQYPCLKVHLSISFSPVLDL